jgi:hypothetical protein
MGSTSKPSAKGRGRKNVARGVVRAVEKDNEFIGKLVAFFLDFPYGKVLKSSFGQKWSDEAASYVVKMKSIAIL